MYVGNTPLSSPDRAIDHHSGGHVDRTGTRAKTTIYQASSTARLVATVWSTSAAGTEGRLEVASDAAMTTPFVLERRTRATTSGILTLSGLVPPNWYYRVVESTATMTLTAWSECDL